MTAAGHAWHSEGEGSGASEKPRPGIRWDAAWCELWASLPLEFDYIDAVMRRPPGGTLAAGTWRRRRGPHERRRRREHDRLGELAVHLIQDRLAADLPFPFADACRVAGKQGRPTADRAHLAAAVARSRTPDSALAQVLGCNRSTVFRLRRDGEQAAKSASRRLIATYRHEPSEGAYGYWAFRGWTAIVADGRIAFSPPALETRDYTPERRAAA